MYPYTTISSFLPSLKYVESLTIEWKLYDRFCNRTKFYVLLQDFS
jgi:hypothetical protein